MKKTIFICIALISLLFMYAVRDSISFKSKNPFRTSNFGAIDSFRIIDNSISFSDLTDPLVGDLDVTGTISASDSMYGTYAKFSNSIEADSIYGSTYIYSVRLFISDIVCSDSIYASHLDITSGSRLAATQFIGDISFSAATFDIGGVTNMVDSLYVEDIISTGNIIIGDTKWIGYGGSEGRLSFDYVNGAQDTLSALGTDILANTGMIIQTDGTMPIWGHSPAGLATEGIGEHDGKQWFDGGFEASSTATMSANVYMSGGLVKYSDNTQQQYGTGVDAIFEWDTAETNDAFKFGLDNAGSMNWFITTDNHINDDTGTANSDHPTILMADSTGTVGVKWYHDGIGFNIDAVVGGVAILDSLYGVDAKFSGDVEMDSLYAANAVITLASLTDLVVSDSIYVANLDVTNSARMATTQFIGDITFDAATHNIGGITNHVDSLYLSNLVAASTMAMIGDFQFKGNISFDAATYNIGGITNHVDSLYLSVLSPASTLYITDAVQLAGNIGFAAATYDIGGVTNMVDSLYVEDVVSAGVVTIAESLIVADRISFPSGENDIGMIVDDLGTATRGIDMSGSGLSGASDYPFYIDSNNYWAADSKLKAAVQITSNLLKDTGGSNLIGKTSSTQMTVGDTGFNTIVSLGSAAAFLSGNKTAVGSIADAASRAGEPDIYKASHGLSAAAGDLLHVTDSSTAADEDFYMIVKVTTDSILVTPVLAGTESDVDFTVYQDVIANFATDGVNGMWTRAFSHQDKPHQLGGNEYEATGHSLGSEDVLIGGTLLEVNPITHFDAGVVFYAYAQINSQLLISDDVAINIGGGNDLAIMRDTNDTNDDIVVAQFIESDGTNIPILVVSDASFAPNGDSKFDDITEPSIGFVDDDADSYFRIGFAGDNTPGIVTDGDRFLIEAPSALTNTVQQVLRLSHTTSGTPATNIGVGMEFEVETSSGNNEILAAIEVIATDVGAGAEDGDIVFKTMTAGATATEAMRITSGDDVMVADCLRVENEITLGTDGSASDPGYTWVDDDDTGLYRISENSFAVTAGNAEILRFSNAEIYASKRLKFLSSAILFSGGDLDFGAGNSTSVKMTLESDGDLLLGVANSSELTPDFSIIGDADSDSPDTDETITLALTQNADPTLATWGWTSTQSAGYTFDKSVTVTGLTTVTDIVASDSIYVANLDVTSSARLAGAQFTSDITFDAATHNIGGITNHVDSIYVSNVVAASTLKLVGDIEVTGLTTMVDIVLSDSLYVASIKNTGTINSGEFTDGSNTSTEWIAAHARVAADSANWTLGFISSATALLDADFGSAGLMKTDGAGTYSIGVIGILDDNLLEVDDAGNLSAGDYTKVTANGLVGRDASEVIDDIGSSIDETGTVSTGTWNSNIAHGLLANAVATDLDGNGLITNDTVGENVGPSEVLFMKSDGKYWKSDADSVGTMPAIAMAMDSIYADVAGDLLLHGYYRNDAWDWTIGNILYVGHTAGALQDSAATGEGDNTQVAGVAITADIAYISFDLTLIE